MFHLQTVARRQTLGLSIALVLLLPNLCEAGSRISGTYVHHGSKFAEMLQLTQVGNGQITGVFSSLELKGRRQNPIRASACDCRA